MDTFKSMLDYSITEENGEKYITMRATHCFYLNDPSEYKLFVDILTNALKECAKRKSITFYSIIERLAKNIHSFIISFSTKKDDLSMWRGYGENGYGINLGFDILSLDQPMMSNESDSNQKLDKSYLEKRDIKKCTYINPENLDTERVKIELKKILNSNENSDVKLRLLLNNYAPIYKNYKYEVESEVRIVKNCLDPNMIKFRISGNVCIPYYEVKVPLKFLKRIVVGPCNNMESVIRSLKMLIYNKLGKSIEVLPSEIPYRDRL